MAIAGKVAITPRGNWNSTTSYQKLDFVFYNDSSYVALKPSKGITPTNTEYWMLALQGASRSEIEGIINGTTQVGDAKTLDGHEAGDFSLEGHVHTASEVGLGKVNNTSDAEKPVSTAQAAAIDAAKTAAETAANSYTNTKVAELEESMADNEAITELREAVSQKAGTDVVTAHTENTSNPHNVTKSQVGLGNVPNVATNDQTPTYTVASADAELTSGEKVSVAFGKIAKAIKSLISHLADTTKHITSSERTAWNNKAGTSTATTSANGLMSSTDKTKLDGIASGANAYTHPNSGVTAGTYRNVTVNAQGHVTAGSNPIITVEQGGTGKTTAQDALNVFINALSTGDSTPTDADYFVSQYASGGTTNTTYHRRPFSALWSYIKSKADSVYAKASHGNHVPTTQTADNATFLRNDNTWQKITPANIGAAASSHGTHVSFSTTAPVMDGTASAGSASTVARSDHKHPVDTSRAAVSHNHSASNITSGTLSIARGGTGATSAKDALTALGGAAVETGTCTMELADIGKYAAGQGTTYGTFPAKYYKIGNLVYIISTGKYSGATPTGSSVCLGGLPYYWEVFDYGGIRSTPVAHLATDSSSGNVGAFVGGTESLQGSSSVNLLGDNTPYGLQLTTNTTALSRIQNGNRMFMCLLFVTSR